MDRKARNIETIMGEIEKLEVGLIDQEELDYFLENKTGDIHGGFRDGQYTGYDYQNQEWIVLHV